jgi:uncharacterized protein (TIGR00251 family)
VIEITDHPEGCILKVRAQPGARKTGLLGEQAGALKLAVSAPPQDGRANVALAEALRAIFKLKRSQVELVAGHTSRDKRFLIRGSRPPELQKQLEHLLRERCNNTQRP